METWKYLLELYKTSRDEMVREYGSAKGGLITLLVGGIVTALLLAGAITIGIRRGWEEIWNTIGSLFIGDVILIFSLWAIPYLGAIFRMPATAARRDFAKDELIATLSAEERPEVERLAKLRSRGVDLRNKGANLETEADLILWIKEYEKWNRSMLREAKKLSPATAQWLTTLDTMAQVPPIAPKRWINSEHLRYARIWSEKLVRLDRVIRMHLGLSN